MKYVTKTYISDVPKAQIYALEIEADTPEKASDLTREHWGRNWTGPKVETASFIEVLRPGESRPLFVCHWKHGDFDPDALEWKRREWKPAHPQTETE